MTVQFQHLTLSHGSHRAVDRIDMRMFLQIPQSLSNTSQTADARWSLLYVVVRENAIHHQSILSLLETLVEILQFIYSTYQDHVILVSAR